MFCTVLKMLTRQRFLGKMTLCHHFKGAVGHWVRTMIMLIMQKGGKKFGKSRLCNSTQKTSSISISPIQVGPIPESNPILKISKWKLFFLSGKKNWGPKIFWSEKMGVKMIWVQKDFGSKTFIVRKVLGPNKILGSKNFGSKVFFSQTKFCVKKHIW